MASPDREAALPNTFAYAALLAWPLVCIILFVMLPVESAAIWSILGGYLLLPSSTSYDMPLLPQLDKFTIPAISTFFLCWMKGSQSPAPRRSFLIYALAAIFVISPVFTSLNNSYEIQIAKQSLPGFYPMDGLKFSLHNLIEIAPFFIGMRFLSSEDAQSQVVKSLATAGLLYSIPMLFEVRFSPQLHSWVYGFFPNAFGQQYRDGGFRPVVFLSHGLEAALFASMAVIAALVVGRARWQILRTPAGVVAPYLCVVLLLCKTLGAALYALIAAPLIFFTRPRTWVNTAVVILLIISAYPLLRTYDLIPVSRFTRAVNSFSVDRSGSFDWRVKNEDLLLAKANRKPFLGWGGWARNRVFQQETGQDITTTDGEWIMRFGSFGWLGYLSLFGLFLTSALRARKIVTGPVGRNDIVLGGLTLMLAVNSLDLIPNANLRPFTYLLAGSIAGCIRVRASRKLEMRAPRRWSDARIPAYQNVSPPLVEQGS